MPDTRTEMICRNNLEHFGIENLLSLVRVIFFSEGQKDLFMLLDFFGNFFITFSGVISAWNRHKLDLNVNWQS